MSWVMYHKSSRFYDGIRVQEILLWSLRLAMLKVVGLLWKFETDVNLVRRADSDTESFPSDWYGGAASDSRKRVANKDDILTVHHVYYYRVSNPTFNFKRVRWGVRVGERDIFLFQSIFSASLSAKNISKGVLTVFSLGCKHCRRQNDVKVQRSSGGGEQRRKKSGLL